MAFILDPQTGKITFGVVADLTHDAIARDIAQEFGVSEDFNENFIIPATWTTTDASTLDIDTTNDELDFDLPTLTTSNAGIAHDLGTPISDTLWVMRFKLDLRTFTVNTDPTGQEVHIGISDSDQTVLSNANQDYIGLKFSSAGSVSTYDVIGADGQAPTIGGAIRDTFTKVPTAEIIYVEIRRTSATTLETNIFSDDTYTVLLESQSSTIPAGTIGLQYVKVMAKNVDGTANGVIDGAVDDIQIWDGITVPVITSNNWRMRFTLDITALSLPSGSDLSMWVGMMSEDETSNSNNAQDGFQLGVFVDNTLNRFVVGTPDNQPPRSAGVDKTMTTQPSVNTFFVEMIRDSASQTTVRFYTDNTYSSISETQTQAGVSGSDSLKYLKLFNDVLGNNANTMDGTFDDFTFTDLSSVVQTDEEFLVDALLQSLGDSGSCFDVFTDDMSNSGNWTATDITAPGFFRISGGAIDFDAIVSLGDNDTIALDYQTLSGNTLSGSGGWRVRFTIDLTSYTNGTNADAIFSMSNVNQNDNQRDDAQDLIGFRLTSTGSGSGPEMVGVYQNGLPLTDSPTNLGTNVITVADSAKGFEIERLSSTTARVAVYTDTTYTTVLAENTFTIPATIVGLDFFKGGNGALAGTGNIQGDVDDLEIVDSVGVATGNVGCTTVDAVILQQKFTCGEFPIFSDDFSTAINWVQTGTQVTIASGEIQGWGPDGGNQRLTHDLVTPLNDKSWIAEFEYEFSSSANPAHDIFVLTDTNGTSSALQDHIAVRFGFSGGLIQFGILHGANTQLGSGTVLGITASINTRYFVRLQRISSGVARLTVFTGGFDSVLFGTIDVDLNLFGGPPTGLQFVQSQTSNLGGAGRTLTGIIDNLVLTNACGNFEVDALIQSQGVCNEQIVLFDQIAGNSGLWTSNTSQIVIDSGGSGVVEMIALVGGATTTSRRATRALDTSFLDNAGIIRMRQKLTKVSGNLETGIFMAIQNGTGDASLGGGNFRILYGHGSAGGLFVSVFDGTNTVSTSPQIAIGDAETQYVETIYDPVAQTLTLNSYSDASFTTHVTGSPVVADTSTISMTGSTVDTVVSSNFTNSGSARVITADLDDYQVIVGGCPSLRVDALIQTEDIDETFFVDAKLIFEQEEEFFVDALIQALGDDGNCPIPATETFYSRSKSQALAERLGEGVNSPFAGITRSGVKIIGSTHAGKAIEDMRVLGIRRNGVGATGTMFATVRSQDDTVIAMSTNSVLAESLPTSGAGDDVTFTFDNKVVLQDGYKILLEFPNCIGCADSASSPNVFWFGTSTASPAGTSRIFFNKIPSGESYFETTTGFTQGGTISFTTSLAEPAKQHGCAEVDALRKGIDLELDFTVDAQLFVAPAKLTLVNAILAGEIEEDFTIDSCLVQSPIFTFTVDACIQQNNNDGTFTVDGHVFILPVRNSLVDAIVRYAQGSLVGSLGAIPDLIIRVLRENPPSLTGQQIVDEINIITSNPAEGFSFVGKTSRIKNWLNRLRIDQLIQEDGSNVDWYKTNWSLGPLGLPLP